MESNTNEVCPECGIVHPPIDELPTSYIVPAEKKIYRRHNDDVWEQVCNGPQKRSFDANQDTDDIVTQFAKNWMQNVQATTNMLTILAALVDKYQITANTRLSEVPPGIQQIVANGKFIATIHDTIKKCKQPLFVCEQIRKDWGSITAFNSATAEERDAWYTAQQEHGGRLLIHILEALIDSSDAEE